MEGILVLTHDQNHQTQAVDDYPYQVRVFQVHAGVFAASIVLIFAVNLVLNLATNATGQWSAWWSVWALIGWGSGIAVHGFVVWLARPGNSSAAHGFEGAR